MGLSVVSVGRMSDQEVPSRAEGICMVRNSAGNRVVEKPQQSGLAGVSQ